MRGSTVQEVRQHLEVTVHLGFTVQMVLVWLNNFHAPMAHIIQSLESRDRTSVLIALRDISVRKEQCSLCHVLLVSLGCCPETPVDRKGFNL